MSIPVPLSMIHDTRRRFQRWPGWLRGLRMMRQWAPMPGWMTERDALFPVWQEQDRLIQGGRVVWGALVQANSQLFQWGDVDCPAQLVYCPEPTYDAEPQRLKQIASAIFDLKHSQQATPELQALADSVTQEMERNFGMSLPPALGDTTGMLSSTFMVYRDHLPDGILRCGLFPILVRPDTRSVMILPYPYWSPDMVQQWMQRELGR